MHRQPIKDLFTKASAAITKALNTLDCAVVGDIWNTVYSSVCIDGEFAPAHIRAELTCCDPCRSTRTPTIPTGLGEVNRRRVFYS